MSEDNTLKIHYIEEKGLKDSEFPLICGSLNEDNKIIFRIKEVKDNGEVECDIHDVTSGDPDTLLNMVLNQVFKDISNEFDKEK